MRCDNFVRPRTPGHFPHPLKPPWKVTYPRGMHENDWAELRGKWSNFAKPHKWKQMPGCRHMNSILISAILSSVSTVLFCDQRFPRRRTLSSPVRCQTSSGLSRRRAQPGRTFSALANVNFVGCKNYSKCVLRHIFFSGPEKICQSCGVE